MSSTAPADFWNRFHGEGPGDATPVPIRPHDGRRAYVAPRRRRPLRTLFHFLLTIAIGIGGTLAWQTFGGTAREMAAAAYPQQLGWLTPAPDAATDSAAAAPTTVGAAAPVATPEQQRLAAVSISLADLRRSVEALAAQVASGQQQATSNQQQLAADIARLQASQQDVLAKLAAPPPRPTRHAPAHKAAPLALSPAALPTAAQ